MSGGATATPVPADALSDTPLVDALMTAEMTAASGLLSWQQRQVKIKVEREESAEPSGLSAEALPAAYSHLSRNVRRRLQLQELEATLQKQSEVTVLLHHHKFLQAKMKMLEKMIAARGGESLDPRPCVPSDACSGPSPCSLPCSGATFGELESNKVGHSVQGTLISW